jgi:hypothetical protein
MIFPRLNHPPKRWIRQVCVDSEGCVQVDGLAQLVAAEPQELLQILRRGLAQPPGLQIWRFLMGKNMKKGTFVEN